MKKKNMYDNFYYQIVTFSFELLPIANPIRCFESLRLLIHCWILLSQWHKFEIKCIVSISPFTSPNVLENLPLMIKVGTILIVGKIFRNPVFAKIFIALMGHIPDIGDVILLIPMSPITSYNPWTFFSFNDFWLLFKKSMHFWDFFWL